MAKASFKARKNVLVVDDHPMTRAGLTQLVDKQFDLKVCGEAGNPADALDAIAKLRPDLILSDITMPGRGGVEFIKDVLAQHVDLPVLVVSMHDELIYAERVLRAGARGYIMKEAGGEELLLALLHRHAGEVRYNVRRVPAACEHQRRQQTDARDEGQNISEAKAILLTRQA